MWELQLYGFVYISIEKYYIQYILFLLEEIISELA